MSTPGLPLAPGLTAGELTHLARTGTPELRAAVAAHPNAPAPLLGELGAEFPGEVLRNPALPLLRLADPQLLHGWPPLTLERLAAHADAPDGLLRHAATHPVIDVQLAAATRTALPLAAVRDLGASPFWTIREVVARRADLPDDVLRALARDPDYGVRLSVTGRAGLPPDVLDALRKDPHPLVRAVLLLGKPS